MKYIISDSQKEVVGKVIQNFIDTELIKLKELAADEDSELSFDETNQIETIESIKLFSLDRYSFATNAGYEVVGDENPDALCADKRASGFCEEIWMRSFSVSKKISRIRCAEGSRDFWSRAEGIS
jgi:hypothetical protein